MTFYRTFIKTSIKRALTPFFLILSLFFAIGFFVSAAQGAEGDCWEEFSGTIYECNVAFNKCQWDCLHRYGNMDQEGLKTCTNSCRSTGDSCYDTASEAYDVCVEERGGSQEEQTVEESFPTEEKPTPQKDVSSPRQQGETSSTVASDGLLSFENADPETIQQITDMSYDQIVAEDKARQQELLRWAHSLLPDNNVSNNDLRLRADIVDAGKGGEIAAVVKYPGSDAWVPLKPDDELPAGTEIFTGFDSTVVLSIPHVTTVEVLPLTKIVLNPEGINAAVQEGLIDNSLRLREGEVVIDVEGGAYQAALQVQMLNAVAGVRGTQFRVKYDEERGYSLVSVYKGSVSVKNRQTGEAAIFEPLENGKPNIIVVFNPVSKNGAEAEEASKEEEISKKANWWPAIIITLVIVFVGLVYLVYRKREKIKQSLLFKSKD
jgi:hypothetical protein